MPVRTAEILFVKCVKNGIPNRDPLRDSDARRHLRRGGRPHLALRRQYQARRARLRAGPLPRRRRTDQTSPGLSSSRRSSARTAKRFSAATVWPTPSWKRSATAHPAAEGEAPAPAKPKKKGKAADADADSDRNLLLAAAFDMRVFGAVFSVTGKSFNQTGPVQFGWAHSLHPVETRYTQGTVVHAVQETPRTERASPSEEDKGKTQGTIWTQYQLPFAVFAMPGIINATIAGPDRHERR